MATDEVLITEVSIDGRFGVALLHDLAQIHHPNSPKPFTSVEWKESQRPQNNSFIILI